MPLVTSRQRSYASLHISLALVHLSAHLAGDRTHSTLAYDLLYTEIVFRVHLYRRAINASISVLSYHEHHDMWAGRSS